MTDKEARVQLQAAPYVGCDLSLEEFEVMRLRVGKGQVNFGYLEFMAKTCSYEVDRLDIPKVGQALREECRVLCFEPAWVVPVVEGGDGDITVTLLGQENDVDLSKVKHIGKLIPSPCDQESVVYVANKSAETACWKDRIETYVKKNEQVVPGVYFAYRNEFVQRLVPSIYRGTGALDDEVTALGRQVRASQKLGYDQIKDLPDYLECDVDSTFLKNEVYPEAKAPRNIVNPGHGKRVLTSMMMYPFTNMLKESSLKHVYGFGNAEYVQQCFLKVESQDDGVGKFESDGTKMDANIGSFFRDLELQALKRYFNP